MRKLRLGEIFFFFLGCPGTTSFLNSRARSPSVWLNPKPILLISALWPPPGLVNGLPITKPSTQQTSETQLPVLPGCLLYYQKTISRGLISYFQSLCHEAFIFYWTIYRFVLKCPTPLMCINSNFSSAYEWVIYRTSKCLGPLSFYFSPLS